MKDRLECYLLENSYTKTASNIPDISLYSYKTVGGIHVISVIDFQGGLNLTTKQYLSAKEKAKEYFESLGYTTVPMLTIILSCDLVEARKFILVDKNLWIIDPNTQKLYIYDDQISDFFGVRKIAEHACEMQLDSRLKETTLEGKFRSSDFYKFVTREFTPVNTAIVLINIIIFVVLSIIGNTLDVEFMLKKGALYLPYISENHQFYRFFTSMFLHFGFMHLVGNMTALIFLGTRVERCLGPAKYVILYIGGGIIGGVGSLIYAHFVNANIVSAGASGAIFAVVGALLIIVIRNHGHHEEISTFRMILLIFYLLYIGMTRPNVDNAAHICGLFGGILLGIFFYHMNTRGRKKASEGSKA